MSTGPVLSRRASALSSYRLPQKPALIAALTLLACLSWRPAAAQDDSRLFAGGLVGVSAVSPDARSVTTGPDAAVSLYDPGIGPVVNLFAGVHVARYFSVQASWMWNRNDITLVSSFTTPQGGGYYEQARHSDQHAVVLDGLVYFRGLESVVRPYLGTGLAVLRFSSHEASQSLVNGLEPPSGGIVSTRLGLRSHVGLDLRLSRTVSFRYSFSETISSNPISPSLTPPGTRGLMNFDNLFGVLIRF